MPEIINIFPLTIYKNPLGLQEQEREKLIEKIIDMEKINKVKTNKIQGEAWLGDVNGHENLHLNKDFDNLFKLISIHIKKYIEVLNIDSSQIDIYCQRSWATISRGKENIRRHAHHQSNISFAYYLKKKEDDSKIIFHDSAKQNEFIPQFFHSSSINLKKIIKKRDLTNSPMVHIDTKEDDIVVFPSKTLHSTQSEIQNNERISIAADISILAKTSENLEHMTPPIEKWKKI